MNTSRFGIISEPLCEDYRLLLHCTSAYGVVGSLVLRDGALLGDGAREFLRHLEKCSLRTSRTSRWPGTELLGHSAELLEFDYRSALPLLCKYAAGLYAWISPDLPEDLAIYRSDGSVCLASCAHERFAELVVTQAELQDLTVAAPRLSVEQLGG